MIFPVLQSPAPGTSIVLAPEVERTPTRLVPANPISNLLHSLIHLFPTLIHIMNHFFPRRPLHQKGCLLSCEGSRDSELA